MAGPLTPRHVFRYFETDGVPDSGPHDPVKSEIIQLLEQLFGTSRGGWIVTGTLAELNGITPENETDGGVVLTGTGAGYYEREGGAWVFGRGFPDTFARVELSGTGATQTGVVKAGVNPATIEVFFAKVGTPNTGPLTLSISGETAKPVVNLAGNPLSAGEWTGMVMFCLNEDGQYQLLIDSGAAASAAASASFADERADDAEAAATRAENAASSFSEIGTNFRTVANLLADTTLGYTGSAADVEVDVGDIVTAQGFRYEVAASGATDAHVETAGGVKLYVLALAGKFYASAFGVPGNGDHAVLSAFIAASAMSYGVIDANFSPADILSLPSFSIIEILGGCTVKLADGSNKTAVFEASDATSVLLCGEGQIDANEAQQGGATVSGVVFLRGSDLHVRGLRISNFGYGVRFIGSKEFSCNDCQIMDGRLRGVFVGNDTSSTPKVLAEDFEIVGNRVERVRSSTTPGNVDGHGIIVTGEPGFGGVITLCSRFSIRDNRCVGNGRSGITVTAGYDFSILGNTSNDHVLNTSIGAGIIISAASRKFTISGNNCAGNYDAGILIDTLDEAQNGGVDTVDYGRGTVSANVLTDNGRAGVKVNYAPHLCISENQISGSQWGVFYWTYTKFATIRDNQIISCSENGIRLAGAPGTLTEQIKILLAANKILNCGTGGSGTAGAIYVGNFSSVVLDGNEDEGCPVSLRFVGTVTGCRLRGNRFFGSLSLGASTQISEWDGSGIETCTSFNSTEFGGNGKDSFQIIADFSLPHFGLEYVPVRNGGAVTGDATQAIKAGRRGQRLLIQNVSAGAVTIPNSTNVRNTGGSSVVLAQNDTVEYVYGTFWRQVS